MDNLPRNQVTSSADKTAGAKDDAKASTMEESFKRTASSSLEMKPKATSSSSKRQKRSFALNSTTDDESGVLKSIEDTAFVLLEDCKRRHNEALQKEVQSTKEATNVLIIVHKEMKEANQIEASRRRRRRRRRLQYEANEDDDAVHCFPRIPTTISFCKSYTKF